MGNNRRRDPIHYHPRTGSGRVADAVAKRKMDGKVAGRGGEPTGEPVRLEGQDYYRISSYHRMPPFLMTLATDTDLWMFVTSRGGLTAGRVDADRSIFPYETVDRLHDGHYHTGPITLLRARRAGGAPIMWEPFSAWHPHPAGVDRNLYKSTTGNRLVFEETNEDLGLVFRYRWAGCDEFGWVRTATLENHGALPVEVELLDGLRNVLPYGVSQSMSQTAGNLADAYKRSEADLKTGLGIFSLTAGISDRPEAVEVLRANTVWSVGLQGAVVHLSGDAIDAFRAGERPGAESVLTGRRGNYLLTASLELGPAEYVQWHMVADVGRSHGQIARLRALVESDPNLVWELESSLNRAGENIRRIVGSSDGMQATARREVAVHHFANVLFNSMRGGVFADNNDIPRADLADFVSLRNRPTFRRQRAFLDSLPETVGVRELLQAARATGDADLERLCHEYLPLYFGRRHGDPSRPWNRFTIHVRNSDGSRALHYEGNWRDIFQNWEALCVSFPGFLPNVVAKFVNASTVDGFNPYRITRDGVDWETPDPDDPWSHIGYWGDHQVIYLLKFLEAITRSSPGELEDLLHREIFSYADVPYRIRPYEEILRNPCETIDFDAGADEAIAGRVSAMGTDGRLVLGADGDVYHVSLLEKLLVPLLSKLSNLVPDGGIWLNTQRPEWNDANNALVGNGVSVVTMCYLRRYVTFLEGLLSGVASETLTVSDEVVGWFRRIRSILDRAEGLLGAGPLGDRDRKRLMDELGQAFSDYRREVYARGFTRKTNLGTGDVADLCRTARAFIDHGIRANRREDGLYNSYVLLEFSDDGAEAALRPLPEMLEGQVAALSSGLPDSKEAAEIMDRLFSSSLYREDQKSFLLYPAREMPSFLDKNVVAPERASAVPLLRDLLELGDGSVVERDGSGAIRFQADFRNVHDLAAALDRLAERTEWADPVTRDRQAVMGIFEDVFNHREYTGRSGAMYSYEGLGCIYWHMVAKLLVAAQETALRAGSDGSPDALGDRLARLYGRIRSGLGFEKTPGEYGAFPTDPYSHTPRHGGAKQPGMTGQVKEEILTRFGELGVSVEDGVVSFRPTLLESGEFIKQAAIFS
ncbi:MAG: hypothetical protein JXB46_10800, partial [Candidatus Eisenbacteria bacterium]|nr:hypothetical protein [Candidatus Eisenbacteria bacterium]